MSRIRNHLGDTGRVGVKRCALSTERGPNIVERADFLVLGRLGGDAGEAKVIVKMSRRRHGCRRCRGSGGGERSEGS